GCCGLGATFGACCCTTGAACFSTGSGAGAAATSGAAGGTGAGCGFGANTDGSGFSPGMLNLRFLVSTTTAFVRPCEKFWRTVPCSRPGRFSVRVFFGVTLKVLSSPDFVSLIPNPLRHHLRQRRPQASPDRPGIRPGNGRAQPCASAPPCPRPTRERLHVSHLCHPMPNPIQLRGKVCRHG